MATVNNSLSAADHRGSSSSETNEKNNVLQAITILQCEESSEGPILDSPEAEIEDLDTNPELAVDDAIDNEQVENELEADQEISAEIESQILPEDSKVLVR